MSDSMWKKEISFKRKPKEDADPDAFETPKQSLLKKEITFKRKPKVTAQPDAFEPKQSVLKKEISFRRKPKADAPEPEKKSFLKKEISLSRKSKPAAEPDGTKQSIWKKDLSLSRGGGKVDREVERLAQAAAQAIEAESAPFLPVQPTELAEAVLAAMPDPDAPQPPEPGEPASFGLVPEAPAPFDTAALGLAPEIVAASAEPASADEGPFAVELPDPAPEPEAADTWVAEPELPPAPAAPEAVTVHPPVPEADLPPVLETAPKAAPFWKKELSLSRRPREPKPPKAPKAPRPESSGGPFWKKELSFGRKRPGTADAVTELLPAAKSEPFWKRSVSLPKPGRPSLPARRAKGGHHKVQKLVGLKVGASQLAAARISNNGVAELQQIAREPLANGVVVAGELRDPEALGDALKVFFARHKLPKKGVRLGIASNRIGVRILDIVGVEEEKQLANAVQFRAQEALPIPLDEAVLDYRVLGETVDADGQTVKRVLLVVAYRELIDRYVSACRKAGIVLQGIDLEAFALLRALGAPADREGSALVAVAIGHDRSTFAVSDGRICEFTRVVEWGGSALNIALARAFDSTPSEVEQIKRELSLDGTTSPEELTPEQASAALDAVRRQIQSFARELVSSLQFYQNQPGSLGIGEIVITGGTAQLPGLAEELERLIGVHVRIGNPLARLKVPKRLAGTDQIGSLAVAIGLGIED